MSRTSLRRLATVVTAAAAVAVMAVPPATAGERYFAKSSSTIVTTSWVEMGTLPGVTGNAHIGEMQIEDLGRGRTRVFGIVFDLTCAPGQVPAVPGGGHGEPPTEDGCAFEGERFIDGGAVRFTIDKKLTTARVTGTLSVSSHGGPAGAPLVDITWTGVGGTYTSRISETGVDEWGSFSYRYTFTGRDAVVKAGSRIGGMFFDNAEGESSQAQMGTQRSSSRQRT